MKNKFQTLLYTIVLCTMFFAVFAGKEVQAAAKAPVCPKSQTIYGYAEQDDKSLITTPTFYSGFIYIKNLAPDAVLSNFKSSNPNITGMDVIEMYKMDAVGVFIITPQKEGAKSKISFTVKQNGKKYNLSCDVTIKKAKIPFKSLKIGNKEYASSFRKGVNSQAVKFPESDTIKISYTPAPGFKIISVELTYKDGSSKYVKNGETVRGTDINLLNVRFGVTKKPTYYTTPEPGAMWRFNYLPLSTEYAHLSSL